MSQLRPTLTSGSDKYCPSGALAYYEVLAAVEAQDGLLHGRLDGWGAHCAIGSYFDVHKNQSCPTAVVDEVASINDSVPSFTRAQRKEYVKRWLKWKLSTLGFSYRTPKPTKKAIRAKVKK
jgi:hypothetical protein